MSALTAAGFLKLAFNMSFDQMTSAPFGFEAKTRAILRAIDEAGSISAAARRLGLDAANATRHLRTAERRAGRSLVATSRGGRGGPNARLLPAARSLLGNQDVLAGVAGDFDAAAGSTPVRVGRRVVHVAGRLPPGPVRLQIPATAVSVERPARRAASRPRSSVRNRWPARVQGVEEGSEGIWHVALVAGSLHLESVVTRSALDDLRLRPGSRVHAAVKAAAIGWHVQTTQ